MTTQHTEPSEAERLVDDENITNRPDETEGISNKEKVEGGSYW